MSGFNAAATPEVLLREVVRLLGLDGWTAGRKMEALSAGRNGRFYSPQTLAVTMCRARRTLDASFGSALRARHAIYRTLGGDSDPATLRLWESRPGRTQEQVERTVWRAIWSMDQRAEAA